MFMAALEARGRQFRQRQSCKMSYVNISGGAGHYSSPHFGSSLWMATHGYWNINIGPGSSIVRWPFPHQSAGYQRDSDVTSTGPNAVITGIGYADTVARTRPPDGNIGEGEFSFSWLDAARIAVRRGGRPRITAHNYGCGSAPRPYRNARGIAC